MSFNALAKATFGISFRSVGGEYEPHTLLYGGRVVSNVSVNRVPFYLDGEKRLLIQLGTVMTAKEFRGRGLARFLMEAVIKGYLGGCDMLYLFANDSVTEFYPKFGFNRADELEALPLPLHGGSPSAERLFMNEQKSLDILFAKYELGNPYSAFYMAENRAIPDFYCLDFMKENVYYSKKYDLVIVAALQGESLICYDIFGASNANIVRVLNDIPLPAKEARLGFSPREALKLPLRPHIEEDTVLFIHKGGESLFNGRGLMFPLLSHA